MSTPCDFCPIRKGCDYLSGLCRLTPSEVARFRPDLIKRRPAPTAAVGEASIKVRQNRAALGFKKYDRRFATNSKHTAAQRLLWRVYKQKTVNA